MAINNNNLMSSFSTGVTNATNYSPVSRVSLGNTNPILTRANVDSGDFTLTDPVTGALSSPTADTLENAGIDPSSVLNMGGGGDTESGFFGNLLKDKNMMGNITGLASTLMQAAALPTMLKQAKLQNKSLQFNLDTAKAEQGRRNQNISAFNAFKG